MTIRQHRQQNHGITCCHTLMGCPECADRRVPQFRKFSFDVLRQLTMLQEITIRCTVRAVTCPRAGAGAPSGLWPRDTAAEVLSCYAVLRMHHDGDVSFLARLPALRRCHAASVACTHSAAIIRGQDLTL
jgi:hypothetical protein